MEQRFCDRVVVTTGAAGGIGKAVSKRFYDEGAKVVMTCERSGSRTRLTPSAWTASAC